MGMMGTKRFAVVATGDRVRPVSGQNRTNREHLPARLTSRGRIVVTGVSALIIGLASVALATVAQASHGTGAGGAGSPGKYVTRVVVRPGQSLWTLAEGYDPDADARLVSADIVQMNALTTDQLQPGQTLWVPLG